MPTMGKREASSTTQDLFEGEFWGYVGLYRADQR